LTGLPAFTSALTFSRNALGLADFFNGMIISSLQF
jgi:hypothetical protein